MSDRTLTDTDIELLKQVFATNQEIEGIINAKLDEKIGLLPTKEEFFSRMDELMGEVQKERQENKILEHRTIENRSNTETIADHLNLALD